MTHDELLAKIQWTWNHHLDDAFVNAIEAIAELHKPHERFDLTCKSCGVDSRYPCPTLQAIEKELN